MNTVHSTTFNDRSPLFQRLGAWVARHRWPVLVSYLVLVVVVGVFGIRVFAAMESEGFNDPASDSSRAAAILADEFGTEDPLIILAIETPSSPDLSSTEAIALLDEIAAVDGIDQVISYWSTGGDESFLGANGNTAQAFVFAENVDTEVVDAESVTTEIVDNFTGEQGDLVVYAFGGEVVGNAFTQQISRDLAVAESIAIPITALLLIFVFGSVVAAGLPFLVAGGTILGSFLVLFIISLFTEVSIFSLNLVTGLGLALGIDYALLIINRFREELRARESVPEAVAVTVNTAGRTVFVSGAAVAVALASLLIFPQYFLRSFAYAGIAVSVLAVIGALTAIPALLAILGKNVNRLKVRRGDLAPKDDGAWARVARFVMRYPWPVLVGTIALLLVMAAPALGAVFGQVDERALPADNPAAQAGQVLREQFPGNDASPFDIVLRHAFLAIQIGGEMMASDGGGCFAFVGSMSGNRAVPNQTAYATSKAALHHLVRCAGVEYAPRGVRVNAVAPGYVRTPRLNQRLDEEAWSAIGKVIPIGRAGTPAEIAGPLLFLVSDLSAHITGEVMAVDGGAAAVAAFPDVKFAPAKTPTP